VQTVYVQNADLYTLSTQIVIGRLKKAAARQRQKQQQGSAVLQHIGRITVVMHHNRLTVIQVYELIEGYLVPVVCGRVDIFPALDAAQRSHSLVLRFKAGTRNYEPKIVCVDKAYGAVCM